ncbi:hypothetical protein BDF20DRAFT_278005 [Mycotypha africana]|uniref:uncharacterized protein n=1 Tax=Mycotypha africana TaxID=64632 RepID=UPI0023006499|nr:uncharacterized protein BDF20DRAFT_278005 [Mycotypha africana]KAI8987601.1 hypothetical protein BDF20DRAFT_278005 [Mycotypha africana]
MLISTSGLILIAGGGVTGLTTAICLLKNGYRDVLVLAKLLPGDLTTEYTSPWAGAAMVTAAEPNDIRLQEMDMHSIKEFERLANTEADAHVMHCPGVQYVQAPNGGMSPDEDVYWARKLYSNFKVIPKEKLVSKTDYGYTFDSCKTLLLIFSSLLCY